MKVHTQLIEGHSALVYTYDIGDDGECMFHLLCEVGQPWQAEARALAEELAEERGCTIQQVELDARPWYVDALVKVPTSVSP